ncbi:zinc-binding dehydrogenase [Anabaena sp. UHCC 0451]|uniref:zinc-binding dehydrogenase n=1 Tax=Anabaena sp. UHCC 0451 TaxID=2055235 RepID=UPI002B1FCE40|nr:zinc-binding dehydrogenase [Anabaena sp. UHCC 0451]MEA5576268.1 zinc-binding dehydrogenase [Anabaena sp. UHCC 0451]
MNHKIRAVIVNPNVPGRLALSEVNAPTPAANEAIIRVAAISLNRGELRRASTAEAGWRPGWDLAGTVETPAADGSGPVPGVRVVGFLPSGAWGELVSVPTNALAEIPRSVSFAQAATLPVAGLTAYHALKKGGFLLNSSVLITGASGGVGNFTIQLARLSGAKVVAHLRQPKYEAIVKAAGAHQVVIGEDISPAQEYGPYHLIIDSVGGDVLGKALGLLGTNGKAVVFGTTAGREVTFNAGNLYALGGASIYGLIVFHELKQESASVGLKWLVELVESGQLRPHIDIEAPWTQIADVAQQLIDRRFPGKAVLHISN